VDAKVNKRTEQAIKRKRKKGLARSNLNLVDPYCVVKDLFSEISKKNLENNKGNARIRIPKFSNEEIKSSIREDSTTSLIIERSLSTKARSFFMIELGKSRSHSSSMIVCNKGFQRQTAEDSEIIFLSMLINGNDEEVLRIQFPYDLSKDSPKAVAKEMVKALSLNEQDLERLQSAIKDELNSRKREATRPTRTKSSTLFNNLASNYARAGLRLDKELHEKVEEILNLADNYAVDTNLEFDACRTVKELDTVFMLEIAKLAQRYRTRAKNINN